MKKDNNRERSLLKNTIIISIGTICTKLVTFFLLPLYTGILSTSEYGVVDLLNTLVFLLIPIITFQVEQAVFRELLETRSNMQKSKKIISNAIFSVLVQCMIFLVLYFIFSVLIKNDYKIYLLLNIFVSIFSSLFLQIARGLGNTKEYSIASFFTALVTIIFNILFLVLLRWNVIGMLLGTFIGHFACVVYLFIRLKLYKYVSINVVNFKDVKELWKYSVPLIPNAISWWVFSSSDRVIVSYILGLSANGILSVSSKFSSIFVTLYNIFDRSWIESISLHINDDDIEDYFNRMFNLVVKLFVSLAVLFIAFMPIMYPILINKNYFAGYNLVPILLVGSIFTVCQGLLAVVYAAKKDTSSLAKTSVVAAILNVVIHLLLINFIGLYAAVISTLASYLIIFIYRFIDIRKKYFKVSLDIKFIIYSLIVISIVFILYYINSDSLNILSILISMLFAFFINVNSIKVIFSMIKGKIIKE